MKYLVAISGGVDSVVLLDTLVKEGEHELIVAHFDHGIRPDSAADARFVEALAARYELPFTVKREELGETASEELARERRYAFLRSEAERHGADAIATAHHADDVVETIALNLTRGTGWRGVAVLDSPGIVRPLLPCFKYQIREYALEQRLEWVEDSTNASDVYLRNRLRRRITNRLPASKRQAVLDLWQKQRELKQLIDMEAVAILEPQAGEYSRYFFTMASLSASIELLRMIVVKTTGRSPTRPQLERALLAIKTAQPGKTFPLGQTLLVCRTKSFAITVKTP